MDALAAGALLAIVPLPARWFGALCAFVGVGGLLAVAWATGDSVPESLGQQRWGLLCAVSLGVGLLVLARRSAVFARAFSARWLGSFGKYSYCIYLTHFLVIEALTRHGARVLPAAALAWLREHVAVQCLLIAFVVVCMAASWCVGFVSWHLFEKHCLAWKRFFPSVASKP